MTVTDNPARPATGIRAQSLAVTGGLVGSMAAMSCCIIPLALFSLGVSGAWTGRLTGLAPYQPYFVGAAVLCLAYGYWLAYRSRRTACDGGTACARPMSGRLVMAGLILATGMIAATLGFGATASLFL